MSAATNTIHSHSPSQNIIFEPYTQKFYSYYDHNDSVVKYYISPDFGDYTKIVGINTILEGFEISNVSYTSSSVSCTVGYGRTIIANTYIEVSSSETITYSNANVLDPTGFFVLSMRFNNYQTLHSNKLTYHLTYFTSDNQSFSDFDTTENLIILKVFSFTKSGSSINSFTEDTIQQSIVLDGVNFVVRKNSTDTIDTLIDGGIIDYDPTDLSTGEFVGGNTILELVELLKATGVITALTVT